MIFGKIDYINLLPLHFYLKSSKLPSYIKKSIEYKKDVPAKLNKALKEKRLDCAIISSIESKRSKYKNLNIGICANKKVLSVLVEKNSNAQNDKESATSNALAKVLKLNGKVIIGDKALKEYVNNKEKYIDMCEKWYELTKLPFMFARFSSIKNHNSAKRILKPFIRKNLTANQRIKIPNYILDYYSNTRKISNDDIKNYLKYIYYKIGKKELKALSIYTKKIYI
ncbi:menaquinone via futalosine step 1 [Campylobacter sp. 2018MI01]|uniref:MqnA/MqnD/SBP family protein n=1 Tax=Campylobacter sp. 2018MI01 TaxID=2836735 RepID=UPI001BD96C35|nr:MqnA/MqnD/SBP family protein [Campylobacter sp. 2018MI01]MBT0879033.1 menaquinone via futalosine step 1 [Campylobacter sp. 2018MI01]